MGRDFNLCLVQINHWLHSHSLFPQKMKEMKKKVTQLIPAEIRCTLEHEAR